MQYRIIVSDWSNKITQWHKSVCHCELSNSENKKVKWEIASGTTKELNAVIYENSLAITPSKDIEGNAKIVINAKINNEIVASETIYVNVAKRKKRLALGLWLGIGIPALVGVTAGLAVGLTSRNSSANFTIKISEDNKMVEVDVIKTILVSFLNNGQPVTAEITSVTSSDESKLAVSVTKDKQKIFIMGVAVGAADVTINAKDTNGHTASATFTVDVTDIKPYFVLKNNNTELWEVVGKTHTGELKEVFVKTIDTNTDKVVTNNNFTSTIEDLPTDNDNEYVMLISGNTPIDAKTTPIKTFPKNITFLGTEGAKVDGFTFINDGSSSKLPEKATFDGVDFTGDFSIDASNGNIKDDELKEWTLKDCEFTNDSRINCLGLNKSQNPDSIEADKVTIDNCYFGQTDSGTKTTQILLDSNYFISEEFSVTHSTFADSGYNCVQIQKPFECAVTIEDNVFRDSVNRPIRISSRKTDSTTVANLTIRDNLFDDCCDDADVEGTAYYMEQIYITGSGAGSFTKEMYESWTFEHNEFIEDDEVFTEPMKYIYNDTDWSWHQTTNGELIAYPDTYLIDPYVKNGDGPDEEIFEGHYLKYNCGSGTPTTGYVQMNGDVVFTFNLATPSWGVDLTSGVTWKVFYKGAEASSGTTLSWLTWNTSTNSKLQVTMSKSALQSATQISGDQFKVEAKYTDPESHTSKERTFIFSMWTENK